MYQTSTDLFSRACDVIPGGVNSPVRAFGGVGGQPKFIERGEGPYLFDVDGQRYIDYVGSWGPLILGHAHPDVIEAISAQLHNGLTYGAPTELEVKLAEKVCELSPAVDMVRMVNSGTEASMTAIRLARGATGRKKIIKFIGCYHGHCDPLLVKAGSGNLTFGVPDSAGIPSGVTADTLVANYNDINQVSRLFEQYGDDIAAVIVEPVAGNMNCVLPVPGFLNGLRQLCDNNESLLIFDEVMTGFRIALGGAAKRFGVIPDLCLYGKIIGGGMPVGAIGGRRAVMEQLAPLGPVYQAGTLSGNPVAMAAGLKTLELISAEGFYADLETKTIQLIDGIHQRAQAAKIKLQCNQIGGMFGLFFTEHDVINSFEQVNNCDREQYQAFFHAMLEAGVYFAPSAFEVGFMSITHSSQVIADTLEQIETVFEKLAK